MPVNASSFPAPSANTIATAVAAAVPTTAGITSIVQANAGSPVGGTWTQIGYATAHTTSTYTFSNLSGYKYLKLIWSSIHVLSGSQTMKITFNGVTSNNYHRHGNVTIGYNNGSTYPETQAMDVNFPVENVENDYQRNNGFLEILNSNSSTVKNVNYAYNSFNSYARRYQWNGLWTNTAAISSITLTLSSSTFYNPGTNGQGFYLIGAN